MKTRKGGIGAVEFVVRLSPFDEAIQASSMRSSTAAHASAASVALTGPVNVTTWQRVRSLVCLASFQSGHVPSGTSFRARFSIKLPKLGGVRTFPLVHVSKMDPLVEEDRSTSSDRRREKPQQQQHGFRVSLNCFVS